MIFSVTKLGTSTESGVPLKIVTMQDIKNELDEKELESWQKLIRIINHEVMNSMIPLSTLTNVNKTVLQEVKANHGSDKSSLLEEDRIADVIEGIAEGCRQSGAALIGGETAEMPGMYQAGDFDLAGFCVGIVEKDKAIDGSKVKPGDVLLALASSGPHSNGYSLIRKIIDVSGSDLSEDCDGTPLADALLAPTKIYVSALKNIISDFDVHALAHITGGGLVENLPRVLPENTRGVINTGSWRMPAVFEWLQQSGNVEQMEMMRTFNCGIGMVAVVSENDAEAILQRLGENGVHAWLLGHIEASSGAAEVRFE